MNKALIVLSGGQDSTTCLFWARLKFDEIHAVSFNYGQNHAIELEAAKKVAEMAGVKSHEIIDLPDLLHSMSPLTQHGDGLERYESAKQMEEIIGNRVEKTFVPMRNMLFLTVAMNRAVELGCRAIVTGICQEDNANYPDCTETFRDRFEICGNVSLGRYFNRENEIHIVAPLIELSKAQSINLAKTIPGCWEALAYTHTSYDGKYPPIDMNHANVLRAKGFEEAGLPDPLVVRAWQEGLMELPETSNYELFS
jgi:7-cyano-7-deazaguanine synthase